MLQSPTKAVYNARHWTLESEEEPPPTFFSRPQTTPVSTCLYSHRALMSRAVNAPPLFQAAASAGGTSKESPSNTQKDDGVFKAPPPPPKVTKCVTVPTDPYQDTVTTLKCRKEHKEVPPHPEP